MYMKPQGTGKDHKIKSVTDVTSKANEINTNSNTNTQEKV